MIALYIVLGIFGLLVVCFLLGYLLRRKEPTYDDTHVNDKIGNIGESLTDRLLNTYLKEHPDSYVLNDFLVPNSLGLTSEIDHVLFTPRGIFVIETKNYRGIITGSFDDKKWKLQVNEKLQYEKRNPIRQNFSHVRAIRENLNITEDHIHNCVIFIRTDTNHLSEDTKPYVFTYREFLDHLNKYTTQVFNNEELNKLYLAIKRYKDNPPCTKEEHIRRNREYYEGIKQKK